MPGARARCPACSSLVNDLNRHLAQSSDPRCQEHHARQQRALFAQSSQVVASFLRQVLNPEEEAEEAEEEAAEKRDEEDEGTSEMQEEEAVDAHEDDSDCDCPIPLPTPGSPAQDPHDGDDLDMYWSSPVGPQHAALPAEDEQEDELSDNEGDGPADAYEDARAALLAADIEAGIELDRSGAVGSNAAPSNSMANDDDPPEIPTPTDDAQPADDRFLNDDSNSHPLEPDPATGQPVVEHYPSPHAGKPIQPANPSSTFAASYGTHLGQQTEDAASNPYHPFASKLDWEIARWAKFRGPSSSSFDDLMAIEGVAEKLGLTFKNSAELNKIIDEQLPGCPQFECHTVEIGGEIIDFYYRNILGCIRMLFSDPDFAPHLKFAPEKQYTSDEKKERLYHDIHTGNWWWATQEALEKNGVQDATIIPIILSSDKSQLTTFRNKSVYPLYMTIGNIPKAIRRKPSLRSHVLLGYLPVTRLLGVTNLASRRRTLLNLYHACMGRILAPIKTAGKDGMKVRTANGAIYNGFPIVACFVGDYPEQVLVTATIYGQCPMCFVPREELGEVQDEHEPRDLNKFLKLLNDINTNRISYSEFAAQCRACRVKPCLEPFWRSLPYFNVYRSITPDILHQLFQGVLKHVIRWVVGASTPAEVDARCRRLPPNHNLRLFLKGISSLSRLTGQEHRQISQFVLGLAIGLPLRNPSQAGRVVKCLRGLLDFLYLAQYPAHSDSTIDAMTTALRTFQEEKEVFQVLQQREHFNIPKIHIISHYPSAIPMFGTTDNTDTQYTERLHIDLAKDAYRATNHKDEFAQMTVWLERREKMNFFAKFIAQANATPPTPHPLPTINPFRTMHLAKNPSVSKVPFSTLKDAYQAVDFEAALIRLSVAVCHQHLSEREITQRVYDFGDLPFDSVAVWHRIKFQSYDPVTDTNPVVDSLHIQPARQSKGHKGARTSTIPARFDTALIKLASSPSGVRGRRVGQIKVVFSLSGFARVLLFGEKAQNLPLHFAYVEWFTPFRNALHPIHGLYKVSPAHNSSNTRRLSAIIPLNNIERSIHLFPSYGQTVPAEWTSSNVLALAKDFFVNKYTDRHAFYIL